MATDLTWTGAKNNFLDVAGNWMPAKTPARNNDTIGMAVAVDSNSSIEVNGLGTIQGATLKITGATTFTIDNGDAKNLLTNAGQITAADGSTLALSGTETNAGSITINGAKAATTLKLNAATTLTGKGTVVLSDSTMNVVSGSRLTNMDNSISGAGTISAPLTNMGSVTATGTNALILTAAITNSGMLAATGTGGLKITGVVTNAIASKVGNKTTTVSGTVAANGGDVTLASAKVVAGILTAAARSKILVTGITTLDGSTDLGSVTVSSPAFNTGIDVASGARLRLKGLIEDTGTINLTGAAGDKTNTVLAIVGAVTLQGAGGSVDLAPGGTNRIEGEGKASTLSNAVSILGSGQIGDPSKKNLTLTNQAGGYITALNGPLDINTGNTVVNEGLLSSENVLAGKVREKFNLILHDSVANTGGTITANGAPVVLATAGLTIAGGTLTALTRGEFLLQANATLSGVESTLTNNAKINVANSILTIAGQVNSTGDIVTVDKGTGSMVVAAATAAAGGKPATPAARFYGAGTINVPILDNGVLEAQAQGDNTTLKINGALTGTGTLKIDTGSTLLLTTAATSAANPFTGAVAFAGAKAKLAVGEPLKLQTPITGFAATDGIDLVNTPFNEKAITLAYAVVADKGTLTVKDNNKVVATLVFTGGDFKTFEFTDTVDPSFNNTTEILLKQPAAECFVSGTRIATVAGPVAVERLAAGDRVLTADGTAQAVIWTGRRVVEPGRFDDPAAVLPVRIGRDALAPGLPERDLLVSPDHGLLIDGWLVQARLLINGASIRQEIHRRVTYHHVELARHDILLAEGVPAESYLDTGNRAAFAEPLGAPLQAPDFAGDADLRARLSCAPLATDPVVTAPIWQRLAERAAALGHVLPDAASTTDPDLHLVVDGVPHRMQEASAGRYVVAVPAGVHRARLRSRAAAPATTRPWLDDRRRLGVAVARIVAHRPDGVDELPVDHPDLADGWHPAERAGARLWRWTDGDAGLALHGDPWLLEVRLAGWQPCPVARSPYAPMPAGMAGSSPAMTKGGRQ